MSNMDLSNRFALEAPIWLIVANTTSSSLVRIVAGVAALSCALAQAKIMATQWLASSKDKPHR